MSVNVGPVLLEPSLFLVVEYKTQTGLILNGAEELWKTV